MHSKYYKVFILKRSSHIFYYTPTQSIFLSPLQYYTQPKEVLFGLIAICTSQKVYKIVRSRET